MQVGINRTGEDWPDRSYRGDLLRWNALIAWRIGQPNIARERFNEALKIAAELNQRVNEVGILISLEALSPSGDQSLGIGKQQARITLLSKAILSDPHAVDELIALGMLLMRFPEHLADARRASIQARLVAKEENYLEAEFDAVLQLSMIAIRALLYSAAQGDESESNKKAGEALDYARQLRQIAERIDLPSVRGTALAQLGHAARFARDVATEQKAFEELISLQNQRELTGGWADVQLLRISLRRGEIEEVNRHLKIVENYLDGSIPAYSIAEALRVLVDAYLFKGEGELAYSYAQKLLTRISHER